MIHTTMMISTHPKKMIYSTKIIRIIRKMKMKQITLRKVGEGKI